MLEIECTMLCSIIALTLPWRYSFEFQTSRSSLVEYKLIFKNIHLPIRNDKENI